MTTPAPEPCPAPSLQPGDVLLVPLSLAASAAELAECERLLSGAERDRAARFVPRAGRRFVAARGQLRRLLGRLLADDPAAITIEVGPRGKPLLGGRHAGRLHFNLSHAQERCLVAVAPGFQVGVDLEVERPERNAAWAELMAGSILADAELAAYGRLPDPERPRALLESWVAKEAVLKATAEGVAAGVRHLVLPLPLPRVRLVLDASAGWAGLGIVPRHAAGSWGVSLIDTGLGGFAALACAAAACRVALVSPGRLGVRDFADSQAGAAESVSRPDDR